MEKEARSKNRCAERSRTFLVPCSFALCSLFFGSTLNPEVSPLNGETGLRIEGSYL